ncbi:hypothetical protein GGI07_003964 [Coemansia sp. Benny D115]|nr:hypothetical protein GGI07_003964 [Coemansia sp. Benny D115]
MEAELMAFFRRLTLLEMTRAYETATAACPTFEQMPLGTPHTAMSHEVSPLTPLEERVFQRNHPPVANAHEYSVFDDDEVLKVYDEPDRQLDNDENQQTQEQHGWRIDNVIDKCGNRLASRSKRLARIVAQRRRGSSEGAATQLLHKTSMNGSSSTGGGATSATAANSAGASPVVAASGGLGDTDGRQRRIGGRRGLFKARNRQISERRNTAGFLRVPEPNHTDDSEHNNGQGSVESGSFGLLADYSAEGSTSTILPQNNRGRNNRRQNGSSSRHESSGSESLSANHSQHSAWQRTQRQSKRQKYVARRRRWWWWTGLVGKRESGEDASSAGPAASSVVGAGAGAGGTTTPAAAAPGSIEHRPSALLHRDRQQIYDFPPTATDEPKSSDKDIAQRSGLASRIWAAIYSFAMPGGYNRFGTRDSGSTYTSSVGFILAFALASVAFIMWGVLAPKKLCSTAQTFTLANVASRKFAVANGIVADFTLSHTSFGHTMRGYGGYEITSVFPLLGQLSPYISENLPTKTAVLLSKCVDTNKAHSFVERWQSESTLYTGDGDMFPERCPFPQSPQASGADCEIDMWSQFESSKVGMLKINTTEVHDKHASAITSWVILDDNVYDVSMYVAYASDPIVRNGTVDSNRELRKDTMFLPESLSKLFIESAGKDITTAFRGLALPNEALYKQCMNSLFLRGTTVTTRSPFACANTNIVAWVTFGLYFLVMFVRFFLAETYAQIRSRKVVLEVDTGADATSDAAVEEARNGSCVVVVPCFDESAETLTRTLQGIARSTHSDAQTLLWVINDGDPAVLNSILSILSHSGRISDPKFYGAYGGDAGGGGFGAAREYSGFYECGRHRIAYVVSAKETYQGRVDSLMMVLNLFRSVRADSKQTSSTSAAMPTARPAAKTIFLDEELETQMTTLGHPPADVAYCLLLGGSVMIDPLAITQLIARMRRAPSVVALSGSLYPVGRPTSLPQLLRFFSFYMRHFVAPIFESLSGTTCPLDQLFTMYRVRLADGAPCLGDDKLVASLDALMKPSVSCRHRTWPANDCLLVPRLVRRFPQCRWAMETNGRAEIEITRARMAALDAYERQWFRTRLVTLLDIQSGRILKRNWPVTVPHLLFPFIMPAASCMLYLEIVISMFGDSPAIVVSELTGAFLAVIVLLLLLSRKWHMALYFLVYSVLGVPFYHVWIPATAFLTMDRVWYPPEHLAAQQQAASDANMRRPANFEAIKNSYLRRLSSTRDKNIHDMSSDSEPELEQESIVENPSDSSRRPHNRAALAANGLGLTLGFSNGSADGTIGGGSIASLNLKSVVVSDALMARALAVVRQLLAEYPPGTHIEPESPEFYLVCERTLSILIPAYPASSVAELAVAVNRAMDELLSGVPAGVPSSPPAVQKHVVPAGPAVPSAAFMPKFSRQGSSYIGSGRPVSVIMEESDNEHQ